MVVFYDANMADMQTYAGETQGRSWNHGDYNVGLPSDWATNNTEEHITRILQAKASEFAFSDKNAREFFKTSVANGSTEKMVVLKGLHQYKNSTAHITVAWTTYLYHFNVGVLGTGGDIGRAALGVKSATEGQKSVGSATTEWGVVGKKGKKQF